MSTSDKTGEKLLQSIRMTKAAGTDTSAAAEDTKPEATGTKAAVKKKAPAKKAPVKRSVGKPKTSQETVDPYRSARRVWPD